MIGVGVGKLKQYSNVLDKQEYDRYSNIILKPRGNRREARLLGILSFVHSTVRKVLFGKVADSLEKGTEHEDEYMVSEKELLVNRFISIPKDMGTFNSGAFVAGIVRVSATSLRYRHPVIRLLREWSNQRFCFVSSMKGVLPKR